jgi:hypothetical protein
VKTIRQNFGSRAVSLSFLLVGSVILSACEPPYKMTPVTATARDLGTGPATPTPAPIIVTPTPPPVQKAYACLENLPNLVVNTNVDAFQLTGGVGGGAGFGLNGILQLVGVNMNYSHGDLDMSMNLVSPLYGPGVIASALGVGGTDNFSISANVVVQLVNGSLGVWKSTGMYQASEDALEHAFGKVINALPALPAWSTVVDQVIDQKRILVPIGSNAGLKAKDQLDLYKVTYIWSDGVPCSGALKVAEPNGTPYATATVEYVSVNSAVLTMTSTTSVEVNDQVAIHQLINNSDGTARKNLSYSLKVGTTTQSADLIFSDGQTSRTVDMTTFLKQQLMDYFGSLDGYYLAP